MKIILLLIVTMSVNAAAFGDTSEVSRKVIVPGNVLQGSTHMHRYVGIFGLAVVAGQCQAAFEKDYRVSADGLRLSSVYVASNRQLHVCEYVQEMEASKCIESESCPSYQRWSERNKAFSPNLPRSVFISILENRRNMIDAITTSRERKRVAKEIEARSKQEKYIEISDRSEDDLAESHH